jgi:NAD(P)-dependent dehydrogenase (short-subunit alcohol dehydrogenase family)
MQVNANAPFILTQGLFDLLDRSEDAKVLFISSSVGRQGRAYWGAYSASKFALEGLSQIFADETETAGNILVYSVNPGATRTAMRKAAYPMEDPTSVPLPESHMDMFLYLLDSPSYATGSQLDARSWSHPKNL